MFFVKIRMVLKKIICVLWFLAVAVVAHASGVVGSSLNYSSCDSEAFSYA